MKKIIKEFWILTILLSVALSGYAYDFEVDGIYYGKNSDRKTVYVTYKTTSYNSYTGSVVIPSTVTYSGTTYSVTSIGSQAFAYCSGLTSVTIPNSVTEIGSGAFQSCSGLTKVEISDIAAWCKINFTYAAQNPLYYAHHLYLNGKEVTNLVIPNSVTSIGLGAFLGCSGLTSVTIPNSVTSIGGGAFRACSGLKSVTIGNSVTSIGSYAFENCSGLTSVTIPNSVTSIGNSAFEDCSALTSVTIGNSVTEIGADAFKGCSALTKVEISDIAAWCKISFVPNGNYVYSHPLTYGGHIFLNGKEVTKVIIPNSVTSISNYAFFGFRALTSVAIPNSVTSIGNSAFAQCSGLMSLAIPNSVTSIGEYAFYNCSGLTSVTIGNSVTSIGKYAFYNCSGLTSVTIGNSVTSISDGAFYNCSGLTSVTIPNSVTSIGEYAFKYCSKILSFTSQNATPPTLPSESVFEGMPRSCQLYVPASSKVAYQTAVGWTFFTFVNAFGEGDIETIDSDSVSVTAAGGAIRVEGAKGTEVEVYSLSGALLYRGTDSTIALPRGIYIVKVAGTTTKVIL